MPCQETHYCVGSVVFHYKKGEKSHRPTLNEGSNPYNRSLGGPFDLASKRPTRIPCKTPFILDFYFFKENSSLDNVSFSFMMFAKVYKICYWGGTLSKCINM